ncbi:hypothetical protein Noda2021_11210 [Candidatus Dependentiae bacterium Noda2021]|nr:hypothetical protein Noda2021_11210 [Candidatus Dependentiae bacterium Noda2021]
MKLLSNYIMIFLIASGCSITAQENNKQYLQELKAFKKSASHQAIFKYHDTWPSIRQLQCDIHNYKEVSFIHRFLLNVFFSLDTIIVTKDTMPQLFSYIDAICKAQNIKTPVIFLPTRKGFFNAAAAKLINSSGGIIIGQKLIEDSTDEELEAVIAHELGHIKYNHVNKTILLTVGIYYILNGAIEHVFENDLRKLDTQERFGVSMLKNLYLALYSPLIAHLIIGKRFEKQADTFAYKTLQKGKGLKGFFNVLIQKHENQKASFGLTRTILKNSYDKLSLLDYSLLNVRYFFAKVDHVLHRVGRWIYHNTRLGAHPSPEARIKAVESYLAQKSLQLQEQSDGCTYNC